MIDLKMSFGYHIYIILNYKIMQHWYHLFDVSCIHVIHKIDVIMDIVSTTD
jgi:hypothetical protein